MKSNGVIKEFKTKSFENGDNLKKLQTLLNIINILTMQKKSLLHIEH